MKNFCGNKKFTITNTQNEMGENLYSIVGENEELISIINQSEELKLKDIYNANLMANSHKLLMALTELVEKYPEEKKYYGDLVRKSFVPSDLNLAVDYNPLPTEFSINYFARTFEDAELYIKYKAQQLKMCKAKWISNERFEDKALISTFEYNSREYFSIYILEQFRNQGLYKKIFKKVYEEKTKSYGIITLETCGLDEFLERKKIPFVSFEFMKGYSLITNVYSDLRAKRSQIPHVYHIDEGISILVNLNASESVIEAYSIHPILQGNLHLDSEFILEYGKDYSMISEKVKKLASDYSELANSYLSNMEPTFTEVKDDSLRMMLIADKVQNYKDFKNNPAIEDVERYEKYFNNWFKILNINYEEIVKFI